MPILAVPHIFSGAGLAGSGQQPIDLLLQARLGLIDTRKAHRFVLAGAGLCRFLSTLEACLPLRRRIANGDILGPLVREPLRCQFLGGFDISKLRLRWSMAIPFSLRIQFGLVPGPRLCGNASVSAIDVDVAPLHAAASFPRAVCFLWAAEGLSCINRDGRSCRSCQALRRRTVRPPFGFRTKQGNHRVSY